MSDPKNLPRTQSRMFRAAALVMLAEMMVPPRAWSQAMQQPVQQKSVIIQVVPTQDNPASVQQAPVQSGPPPAPEHPAPPVAAASEPENPGLINEIGKLFKNSPSIFPAMPSLESWGKSTDAFTRVTTIVKGRMACPVAANGAPDCKAASDKLCQSKGFKGGKSLDTDAAQSCSAKAMISGRKTEEGDCRTENYVTQALCQ